MGALRDNEPRKPMLNAQVILPIPEALLGQQSTRKLSSFLSEMIGAAPPPLEVTTYLVGEP